MTASQPENNITAQFIQRSIYKSLRELPALPDAVLRVVAETNLAEPSTHKIEKYVATDQALASKILRVVNSAYYGLSGQVSNLGQAVMILGMQQVRNLVLSVGALSLFDARLSDRSLTLKRFWHHSFSTAAGAQTICRAKRLDRATVDQVFVAGLLHDIGKLFLYANFTNAYEQLVEKALQSSVSVENVESTLLGINHAEVGEIMSEFWKLPDALTRVIGNHEGPFNGSEPTAVYCVHVADCLTKHLYFDSKVLFKSEIDPFASEWLDLNPQEFEQLKLDIDIKSKEAMELFTQVAA